MIVWHSKAEQYIYCHGSNSDEAVAYHSQLSELALQIQYDMKRNIFSCPFL